MVCERLSAVNIKWHWDRFSPSTSVFPCQYKPSSTTPTVDVPSSISPLLLSLWCVPSLCRTISVTEPNTLHLTTLSSGLVFSYWCLLLPLVFRSPHLQHFSLHTPQTATFCSWYFTTIFRSPVSLFPQLKCSISPVLRFVPKFLCPFFGHWQTHSICMCDHPVP